MKKILLLLILLMSSGFVLAQSKTLWKRQSVNNLRILQSKQDLPNNQTFSLDIQSLKQALKGTPQRGISQSSNVIISLPNANGGFERFRIFEASVMAPDLAARYPEINSYVGQGIDDPSSIVRFSVTPLGFQSMQLSGTKSASFIEPLTQNGTIYTVFSREQRINMNNDFECSVSESVAQMMGPGNVAYRNANDGILREYRLAVSASGGYTQFHDALGPNGPVADALAAIATTMTRVNGIFEVDFAVTLTLIGTTDQVIYTDPATDPYVGGSLNDELQTTLTAQIGENNYDVGHLFATEEGNSGNAGCIGCVCVDGQKGSGWTSRTNPIGDPFDVDYVAHELGHQFGARHTFTWRTESGSVVQVEPGSGTTIMSYAGIVPGLNVENNVTPNFHGLSIEQVTNYIQNPLCEVATPTGNATPVVNAGPDYTIPRGTPFILEGSATDADTSSSQLTYVWEQTDNGTVATTEPDPANISGPAFRCYEPDTNTDRYFPRLETIKTGATSWQWEAVPNVARDLNFRLTVRDNEVGGGANSSDDVTLTVNGTAGPFVVNSPNTNVTWDAGSFETVTWDVAGTTGNGVNTANVDIFLSTDGGDTYPVVLALGVPNDGTELITVPVNQGNQNRVMVRGENHIFFDISDTNFTIGPPSSCTASVPTGLAESNVSFETATLNWNTIANAAFDIRYRPVGSGTWIDDATSNTNINLVGLLAETEYEAQVRSRCPDNSTSAYSGIITFTTAALPPCIGTQITSYPYIETFDIDLGNWTQASGDDGDWVLDAGGTPSPNTGPSDDITVGGNYLFLEASNNGSPGEIGANATAILESPCFDLNGLITPTLTFYYHAFGTDTGSLVVEASDDNGVSYTQIFSVSGNQGDVWNFQIVDLSAYLDSNIKIRITGTTGGGFASDTAIDQIRIGEPAVDTEAPVITLNGAAALNLILGDTYTELGATATDNVDGDISANIVIGGDTVDTNTLGTYVVTYNVSDAAGNPADEVTRTIFVTEYCISVGNLSFETGVTRVVFGTIDNADGPLKDSGYEDFTSISTTVDRLTTVDLTVNLNTDGAFTAHGFAWIDWNQNNDFTDPGEEYDLGDINNVEDGSLPTLPILIPGDAVLGDTRMRISARYNINPTPCLNNFDGEVEDYTVTVQVAGADTEAPVITLNGSSVLSVTLGDTYTELGATATDNVDGDLTSSIVIGGDTVDTNTLGTYLVTYNVSDAAGNAAVEVIRTVNVTNYCASVGNLSFETEVTQVVFGSIDNSDGPFKDNGYEDFTTISTDAVQGTTLDLTVYVNTDGNFTVHVLVWIDWNQNEDFTDPGEEYDLGDITGVLDGALPTLPITIPESFNFGTTRMRVSAQYDADPTPCLNDFDGEVEDYTVDVKYNGLLYSGGTWDPNAPDGTTSAENVLILDGIYVAASDIDMNDILVNTGATISIPKEYNINVGGNITNNGEFVLNSDSNEFSSLIVNGTITGNVKYNRYVNSQVAGNDLIAPPVSGEAFTSFISNNPNVFANGDQSLYLFGPFEKPLNEYITYSNVESATLTAGVGYRTASTDNATFTFEGAVTNGVFDVPIIKNGIDFDKWNLVGNPYTSYIRLDTFLSVNLAQLDSETAAVYGYDADESDGSVWSIWNLAYLGTDPNALIPPGQAFFVSSPDGTSTVSFTPAMQTTGSSDDFIEGRSDNFAKFILRMESTEEVSQTDFYLREDTTLGLDVGYDAGLFEGLAPDPFLIYSSFTQDNSPLNAAIQCINFNDANGSTIIPIGVNLSQGQSVTISLNTAAVNYDVYLEDTFTNTITLLNDSEYIFTANSTLLGTGRFYLRFEGETLSDANTNLEDTLFIYNDTQKKQIVIEGLIPDDTEFVLYDVQGRLIIKDTFKNGTTYNTVASSNFANGVYLIQLSNSEGSFGKKLVIR